MNKEQSEDHDQAQRIHKRAARRTPDEGTQLNAESRGRESQLHDEKHTHTQRKKLEDKFARKQG